MPPVIATPAASAAAPASQGPTPARQSLADAGIPLGPLDGRYRAAVAPLADHLSEAALNRNRIHVEVEWFIHLANRQVLPGLSPLTPEQETGLRAIVGGVPNPHGYFLRTAAFQSTGNIKRKWVVAALVRTYFPLPLSAEQTQ